MLTIEADFLVMLGLQGGSIAFAAGGLWMKVNSFAQEAKRALAETEALRSDLRHHMEQEDANQRAIISAMAVLAERIARLEGVRKGV